MKDVFNWLTAFGGRPLVHVWNWLLAAPAGSLSRPRRARLDARLFEDRNPPSESLSALAAAAATGTAALATDLNLDDLAIPAEDVGYKPSGELPAASGLGAPTSSEPQIEIGSQAETLLTALMPRPGEDDMFPAGIDLSTILGDGESSGGIAGNDSGGGSGLPSGRSGGIGPSSPLGTSLDLSQPGSPSGPEVVVDSRGPTGSADPAQPVAFNGAGGSGGSGSAPAGGETNDRPPPPTPGPANPVLEGDEFTRAVVTLFVRGALAASYLTAVVNWGDGTTSIGVPLPKTLAA